MNKMIKRTYTQAQNSKSMLLKALTEPVKDTILMPIRVRTEYLGAAGIELKLKNLFNKKYQGDFPYFLFGEFDRQSNYSASRKFVNTLSVGLAANLGSFGSTKTPYYYAGSMIPGISFVPNQNPSFFAQPAGFNYFNNQKLGDYIEVYNVDALQVPPQPLNCYVVTESPQAAYVSLCNNTANEPYNLVEIRFVSDNPLQYLETIKIITIDKQGKAIYTPLNPSAYKSPMDTNTSVIVIPCDILLNRFVGFASIIKFNTSYIDFTFKCLVSKQSESIRSNIR